MIAPYDPDDEFRFDEKPAFNGVFDGNGKTLAGLRIKTDRPFARLGLVYKIGESGIIRNLRLASADIQTAGLNATAAVLCLENKGLIENCQSTGKVDFASKTGSLSSAGLCLNNARTGKIIRSFTGGDGQTKINGWQSGGLCSVNEGLIERSGAEVEIRGSSSGGLVSANQGGILRECYSGGVIAESANVGGLCDTNSGVIENCISRTELFDTGQNASENYIGGLVGYQRKRSSEDGDAVEPQIRNSLACGSMRSKAVIGGLVGKRAGADGAVEASYWNTETTGATESQGGTGLSTAQMKDQSTFAGWDFKAVWSMGANGPELRNAATARRE